MLGLLFLIVDRIIGIKQSDAEPHFLPSGVPYIGHVIGIIRRGVDYYDEMTEKHGKLIYSLAMPGGRLYVVNSSEHMKSIEKAYREISFWFIEASFSKRLAGISNASDRVLRANAEGIKGEASLVVDGMRATHAAMGGQDLHDMVERALQRAARILEELKSDADSASGPASHCLWSWTRHVFSLATSSAVYGPKNPYEDLAVEQGLYQFEDSTMLFLSGLPHQMFNRKGFAARETIVRAFTRFFADKSDEQASQLVKNRAEVLRRYGIPENDVARFETVNGFGILLNLLPTAYWTIWHIFSDRTLLDAVREEAQAALGADASLKDKRCVDAAQQLPLLNSVMHEVLRYNTTGAAVRRVMRDHVLSGQFLLKKDSYCLVPNKGIHFNTDQWGANARSFQPDRFLKGKTNRESFRGFGGGVNACPGKAFATRLILTIVAALVLHFDIEPCTESGILDHPGHDESSMAIVVARPARKYRVKFVRRARREE